MLAVWSSQHSGLYLYTAVKGSDDPFGAFEIAAADDRVFYGILLRSD